MRKTSRRRPRGTQPLLEGKVATDEKNEYPLTRREREVLRLGAEGQTDRKVAERLVMSHRTVNRHLSTILSKLVVPGRAAAFAYLIRQGWA
jgi:DNA-binding NarL/FixJ family response regulator